MHLPGLTNRAGRGRVKPMTTETYTHRQQRDADVITAVQVARDWAIQQQGNTLAAIRITEHYMRAWLSRNDAVYLTVDDLVVSIWQLADLTDGDPLNLIDEGWRGTSEEARQFLRAAYLSDLQDALNRITWKA